MDIGFSADCLRCKDKESRLLETEDWEERAEMMDEEGEAERGVDISELAVLYVLNAIGRLGVGRCGSIKKQRLDVDMDVELMG